MRRRALAVGRGALKPSARRGALNHRQIAIAPPRNLADGLIAIIKNFPVVWCGRLRKYGKGAARGLIFLRIKDTYNVAPFAEGVMRQSAIFRSMRHFSGLVLLPQFSETEARLESVLERGELKLKPFAPTGRTK
jgi:hypothetical protein